MNEVKITVDDRTKTLRFKEALTSGSKYRVVVDGGAEVCGAAGNLVLMARGELVAFAELTDGEGELSTNTREMEEAVRRMPVGALFDFDAILHKKDDAEGENVAIGICRVVAAGGAWTDDTTGALTLYKGEKGAAGADGNDGKDGKSAYEVAVANGYDGSEAEWLETLRGKPGAGRLVQLIDEDGTETGEFYKVVCREVDGEKVLCLEQTAQGGEEETGGGQVLTYGDQTIDGVKTFKVAPVMPGYVKTGGDETVAGTKTFSNSPLVPTPAAADNSTKAASTGWVARFWAAAKSAFLAAENEWSEQQIFSVMPAVPGGIVTASGDQTVDGTKQFSNSPLVPTPPAGDNSTKVATTAWVKANATSSGTFATCANFMSLTATLTAKTISGLTANTNYKIVALTYTTNSSAYLTFVYTAPGASSTTTVKSATGDNHLKCLSFNVRANASGVVTFQSATSGTNYCSSFVALVYKL